MDEKINRIEFRLHLLSVMDAETAIILSFLYKYKGYWRLKDIARYLNMSPQRISVKTRPYKEFFHKKKVFVEEDEALYVAYSLSEKGEKIYENEECRCSCNNKIMEDFIK